MTREYSASQVLMIHSRPVFVGDNKAPTFICTGLDYLRIPDERLDNVSSKRFIHTPTIIEPCEVINFEEIKASLSDFKDNFAVQRMMVVLDDIAVIADQCPNALTISADTIFKSIWYSDDPDRHTCYANILLNASRVSDNVSTCDPEIFKNCGYVHVYPMVKRIIDQATCAFGNSNNQENPVDAYVMECCLEFISDLIRREWRNKVQEAA